MRIAMVGPFGFHPNKSMRSRALPLAAALSEEHQVKIFMPPWQTPDEADRSWQEKGVDIRYVALGGGPLGASRRMLREVLAWKPDVVHAFKPKAHSGLVSWWLWSFYRRQIRLIVDTDDWEGSGGWNDRAPYTTIQKYFFNWQEHWGLTHNHGVTVASRTLQSLVLAKGVPADRVYYLPNGSGLEGQNLLGATNREELGLRERPVLLLYTRLFEYDSARLIDIIQRVQNSHSELAVLVVGLSLFDEDANAFRDRAAEAGLGDLFHEQGWIEESDLPAMLRSADVAIYLMDDTLLNRAKCPVKLADMAFVGQPVVAEDVGQVSEYVQHNRTGLLYKSGDTQGIAVGISELLNDNMRRENMSSAAEIHIRETFSWRLLAKTANEAYGSASTSNRR